MRRYRARIRAAGLKEVRRWVPKVPLSSWSDHRLQEIRSLAMHALIARKLVNEPRLLSVPRRNLERWRAHYSDPPQYLVEWAQLLRRPVGELAAILTDPGEEATRLRQSSPFVGVLTQRERKRLFEAFRA